MPFIIDFKNDSDTCIFLPTTTKLRFAKDKHPFFQKSFIDESSPKIGNDGCFTLKHGCGGMVNFNYSKDGVNNEWIQCTSSDNSNFAVQLQVVDQKLKKIVIHMQISPRRQIPKITTALHLLSV